jgi:hypothetical protein
MTRERQKEEAARNEHELKMIAEVKDKIKLEKQLTEEQHKENDAQRKDREAQRKHDREEGKENRKEAEKQRQHEKEESEKRRQFADRQQLKELHIERARTDRVKYELERVKRIEELLGKFNFQHVETIKDILSPSQPQEENRVKAKRGANGHQVDRPIENYT